MSWTIFKIIKLFARGPAKAWTKAVFCASRFIRVRPIGVQDHSPRQRFVALSNACASAWPSERKTPSALRLHSLRTSATVKVPDGIDVSTIWLIAGDALIAGAPLAFAGALVAGHVLRSAAMPHDGTSSPASTPVSTRRSRSDICRPWRSTKWSTRATADSARAHWDEMAPGPTPAPMQRPGRSGRADRSRPSLPGHQTRAIAELLIESGARCVVTGGAKIAIPVCPRGSAVHLMPG
jgi:hypothetical protein